MKEIFYFIRDKKHKPVISVCLLLTTGDSPARVGARGVAICSDRDTPCSKLNAHQSNGPGIAKRRAWKAWSHGTNLYVISRLEAIGVLDRVRIENEKTWKDISFPEMYLYKAFYFPALSPKEQRILTAMVERENVKPRLTQSLTKTK